MKRYFIPILITICFAVGCMTSGELSSTDGITLNNRHLGWATEDCAACHAQSTFMNTSVISAEVHNILRDSDGDIYYDGCRSCHGYNGKPIDNTELTNCTMCHSSNALFIQGNAQFDKSHTKRENLTPPFVNCKSCHDVTKHPERATTLYTMSDSTCLSCHTDHGVGLLCGSCHKQDNGAFSRGVGGIIEGHRISIP